jgi:hypothetical protein
MTTPAVSPLRLNVLRAVYLIMFAGLALTIWPLMLDFTPDLPVARSSLRSMLAAVSLLALVGVRYPLKMLPLMLFEIAWKTIWLALYALKHVAAGPLDPVVAESIFACALGAIFLFVVPWRYVYAEYVRQPADSWRGTATLAR